MMKLLKRIVLGFFLFIILSLAVYIVILRLHYTVPILMYHSIAEGGVKENQLLIIKPQSFEKQMKFLRDHRYNVVYVYEIAEMIKNKVKIPPKTVAVTFDDGNADNFSNAFPTLKKYRIPATIFMIVDYVNKPGYVTLEQLRVLSNSGVDIGCHTQSHLWLTNTNDPARWREEIIDSKKALEKLLGKEVKSFSYPGGAFNAPVRELVKEAGYQVAVATSPGKKFPNDDIYALKRLRISSNSDNPFVFWVNLTGSYMYIKEQKRHHHRVYGE